MDSVNDLRLSVIIPTRNHARLVADLLDTLANQETVSFRWEVLVVDNGSTDQTEQVTKEKILSLPIDIRYICEPNPGLHNGRHRGALEAKGEYLAYLDDDVLLTPTWIHGVEKLFSGEAEAVVGRILPKWENRPPAWLTTLTRKSGFSGYLSILDKGSTGVDIDPVFVYGDNFFIPKHVVFDLKGFHPDGMPANQLRYRGDGEYALMLKFKKAGLRAWYDPGATVYHRIPRERMSMRYLCKRSYAQGISDSFTEIRALHYGDPFPAGLHDDRLPLPHKTFKYYISRLSKKPLSQIIATATNYALGMIPFSQPNLYKRLSQAHLAGYRFHQNEVQKDPELFRWVVREDYWDCIA